MSYHLQNEIQHLRTMTQKMAGEVEQALNKAVHAFLNCDCSLAKEVIANDDIIDMAEIALEEECLKTLALYQPVAIDLRFVVSCLKINSDLERIGDLAVKIAKRSLSTFNLKEKVDFDFHGMMQKTQEMLKLSLDSLLRMDVIGAREVTKMDNLLDEYKVNSVDVLTKYFKKDPENCEIYLSYLSLVRALERIGDYATNIAEDVIYMLEGIIIRHNY